MLSGYKEKSVEKTQDRSQRKKEKVIRGIKKGKPVGKQWVSFAVGYFSYLHSRCTMHKAYWLKKLDCHGQDGTVKIILALASGDIDSDPSFTTYWLYVIAEVIRTF